jgi:vacuolar protein sorting-associated protein 45
MLAKELDQPRPRYAEYHIFFSGILPPGLLRKLAEADVHSKIMQVQEYYADFLPMNPDLMTLQCRNSLAMTVAAGTSWAPKYASQYERHVQGIQSLLLALKRQPFIRYAGHSPCAEELAKEVADSLSEDVFQFRKTNTLLLILDRRDDPVTPLLSQWTYQAMVHELLGLNNHRVSLRGAPNIPPDLEQVVLQDEFFEQNRNKNFGELGEEIQRLLKEYQRQTAHSINLNTIEEMQQFMDKYPELRSQSHNVSKHVAIMGELARLVQVCSLMDVSQLEQELACAEDHQTHWRELLQKLSSPTIKVPDKLRLGLLYALRYEVSGNLHMLQSAMSKGGVPPDMVNLVSVMLRYAGRQSRGPGLFASNLMTKIATSLISSVQGVENVYTQHVPLLMETIQAIAKGKLSSKTHPVIGGSSSNASAETIPNEILVFIVGGVTYEEATKVTEWNQQKTQGRNIPVLLGGSTVHNSTSFLEELRLTAL